MGFRASVPVLGDGQCFLFDAVDVVVETIPDADEDMVNMVELVRAEPEVGNNNDDVVEGAPPFGNGDGDMAWRLGDRGSLPTSVARNRRVYLLRSIKPFPPYTRLLLMNYGDEVRGFGVCVQRRIYITTYLLDPQPAWQVSGALPHNLKSSTHSTVDPRFLEVRIRSVDRTALQIGPDSLSDLVAYFRNSRSRYHGAQRLPSENLQKKSTIIRIENYRPFRELETSE